MSATEVRERVSVSWAEQLQAAHISPGIYICSVLFLHRLISHMHVFVPPLPNSPLLFSFPNRSLANFLLISYFSLPFFFFFFSPLFFPPASLSSLHLLPSLFGSSAVAPPPLPATEKLLNFLHVQNQPRHSGALSPSVDQKKPSVRFNSAPD